MYVLQKYGHLSRNHGGDVWKPYDYSYHCGLWTTVRDVIAICVRIRKASENMSHFSKYFNWNCSFYNLNSILIQIHKVFIAIKVHFSKTVHKTYIQYKSNITIQFYIIHSLIYMAMGARNPYRLVSSISDAPFPIQNIRGAMCILSNFVHKTTLLCIYHIS